MNDTNRAVNRILLLIIGLIMLALGAAAVAVLAWPLGAQYWADAGQNVQAWVDRAMDTTRIGETRATWLALGLVAAIVIVLVLLVVALATGTSGRRSKTFLRSSGAENTLGRVTVGESFASDALTHSLGNRDDIVASRVTANDIRRRPVMHVSVTPRQNTSPRQVAEDVDHLVTNLATLTGQELPTYISIHSGLRARLAPEQRRLS